MVSKLSENGVAGFVLANGSMLTNTSGEGMIRQKMVENDLVDCMIAMPGQLFYTNPQASPLPDRAAGGMIPTLHNMIAQNFTGLVHEFELGIRNATLVYSSIIASYSRNKKGAILWYT